MSDKPPNADDLAREMFGLPPEWTVMLWRVLGTPKSPVGIAVTGAVCIERFKSGPRKGNLNWGKRDKSTEMTVAVPHKLLTERRLQWERETGKCENCAGSGQEWAGWNLNKGNYYRNCRRCKATGNAP